MKNGKTRAGNIAAPPSLRVITGRARGCRLTSLPGLDTRPTSGRVKQCLFSAIQFEIEGRAALDLFAGSGQLGIELLSRGAESCVFVESSRAAADVIRSNLAAARVEHAARVVIEDARSYLDRTDAVFDIVLLDPPYASPLLTELLPSVCARIRKGGIIACETGADNVLPQQAGNASLSKIYRCGGTSLWVFRY